jgi:hypothetical protein
LHDGWQFVSLVAGEPRDPQLTVVRSIVLGVLVVIAVYVSANLAYLFVLGQPRIAASPRVATDAMSEMAGPAGATVMTIAILCSIFGAISANILAGPRVLFAMARDGRLFPWLAQIHPRHETPANAVWALAIWAGVLTLTGGFEHLITMSQFANWIFFTMVVMSVMVLRRTRPDWPRPYRVAGYPFTVLVFVIVSSVFVINTLVESPASSLMGLGSLIGRALLLPAIIIINGRPSLSSGGRGGAGLTRALQPSSRGRAAARPHAAASLPGVLEIAKLVDAAFWASRGMKKHVSKVSLVPRASSGGEPMIFERSIRLLERRRSKRRRRSSAPAFILASGRMGDALRVWGTTGIIPAICFVIEVMAPGLLVIKHHRGEESGKFVNVAVLEGDQINPSTSGLESAGLPRPDHVFA